MALFRKQRNSQKAGDFYKLVFFCKIFHNTLSKALSKYFYVLKTGFDENRLKCFAKTRQNTF